MRFWDFKRGLGSVALLVADGRERGLSETALLRGSGISPAQLGDPNVEIAATQELRVIANFLRLGKAPPGVGIQLGSRFRFSTYGLWGYGLVSSATALEALQLALRYLPLTYLFTQLQFRREGALAVMQFEAPDFTPELQRFAVERDMSAAASLMRELTGETFSLQRFAMRLSRPPDSVAPERLFGAALSYGARSNQLVFEARLLERRLPDANPITAAMCEQLCAELVRRRGQPGSTSEAVRQYLEVPGMRLPDLAQMSRHLNTSERSLKRRLLAEGSSFRVLLEQRRRALARELLRERRLSLAAIAERLGYADLSSFSQAHKRWHGVSPSARR